MDGINNADMAAEMMCDKTDMADDDD